jgi:hypothetical protein
VSGYKGCAVTSVPAADVEGAVLAQVKKLLAMPELVARTWATAKREDKDEVTERDRRSGLHRAHRANRSRPDSAIVKAIARACRRPPGPAPQAGERRATMVAGRGRAGATSTRGSVPGVVLGQGARK